MSTLYNIIHDSKSITKMPKDTPFYIHIPAYMDATPPIKYDKQNIRISIDKPDLESTPLPKYGLFLKHGNQTIRNIEPYTSFEVVVPATIRNGKVELDESQITVLITQPSLPPQPQIVASTEIVGYNGLKYKAVVLMNRVYLLDRLVERIKSMEEFASITDTLKRNIKLQAHYLLLFHYLLFLKLNMTQEFYDSATARCGETVPKYTRGATLKEYIKQLLHWASKCNEEKMGTSTIKIPVSQIQEVLDALYHTYVLLDFVESVKIDGSNTIAITYPTETSIKQIKSSLEREDIVVENVDSEPEQYIDPFTAFETEWTNLVTEFDEIKHEFDEIKNGLDEIKTEIRTSLKEDTTLIDSVYELINDVETILVPEYNKATLEDLVNEPFLFVGDEVDISDDPDFSSISLFDVAKMPIKGGKKHKKTRKHKIQNRKTRKIARQK